MQRIRFTKRRIVFGLSLIVQLLVSGGISSAAAVSSAPAVTCSAFDTDASLGQQSFFNQIATWDLIKHRGIRKKTIVQDSVRAMARNAELDQAGKIEFWRATVKLMVSHYRYQFTSDEFVGVDGSILFQGSHQGIALVIAPNGDIYRGQMEPRLDPKTKPRPLWNADYTGFRLIPSKLPAP